MNRIHFRRSLWLAAVLLATLAAGAQTQITSSVITHPDGNRKETVLAKDEGKTYRVEWLNEKMTGLQVNGVPVPQQQWPQYSAATARIRQALKTRAKDAKAAAKNQAEAQKDRQRQEVQTREQPGKSEARSKAMAELLRAITADLVHDQVIQTPAELKELRFEGQDLIVNGVRQPAAISHKYTTKYSQGKFGSLYDHFHYSAGGQRP